MSHIIFDTGVIINLAINNLLWILPELKRQYGGEFIITPGVEEELIRKPLSGKKFKLEAIQVLKHIDDKVLKIDKSKNYKKLAKQIDLLANNIFSSNNHPIKIVHTGEIEALAYALTNNSDAIFIDERIMRELIENPKEIEMILKRKLHRKITTDQKKLKELKQMIKGIKVLRSAELVIAAHDMNLFRSYDNKTSRKVLKNVEEEILDGLLWGVKLNGCSINDREIKYIEDHERK